MRNKKSVILKSYVLLLSVYIHNLCTYCTGLSNVCNLLSLETLLLDWEEEEGGYA